MSDVGQSALRECANRLGYAFLNEDLLRTALIHRSWQAENEVEQSNERLEFLGDAVLGWAVADIAYHRLADMHEGKLTDLRISVVNMHALAERARALGLGEFLYLGKGEDAAGGRDSPPFCPTRSRPSSVPCISTVALRPRMNSCVGS